MAGKAFIHSLDAIVTIIVNLYPLSRHVIQQSQKCTYLAE